MEHTQLLENMLRELQTLVKSVEQLSHGINDISRAIEKLAPTDLALEPKAKRAPMRKKVLMKHGKVEKIKRIPASKIVYDIIQNSVEGIDTAALMRATGFNQRKIHNITFRLKKQGRINSSQRGLYKKA